MRFQLRVYRIEEGRLDDLADPARLVADSFKLWLETI
jgi:hypothetical protein